MLNSKAIIITVNNPYDYAKDLLEQLIKLTPVGYDVYIAVEPKYYVNEERKNNLLELANKLFSVCGNQVHICLNKTQLGVCNNPYNTLAYVFNDLGYQYVLYLEEDLILGSDIIQVSDWYGGQETVDPNLVALCLCNRTSTRSGLDPRKFITSKDFKALGVGIHKSQWNNYFRNLWHRDFRGWDWSIIEYLHNSTGKYVIIPELSRATHKNTLGGAHFRTGQHWKDYKNMVLNTEYVPTSEFFIVKP